MMINLVTLFASHLDLNGDQANLKVLSKRLEWFGYECTITPVEKGQVLPEACDLMFLGHGSKAAWLDIKDHLDLLFPKIVSHIQNGAAFFAVASGYEKALDYGIFNGSAVPGPRVSKFEIAQVADMSVLGYVNAASSAPVIQKSGLLLGTQLHGPVLAKNPKLADLYLSEILKFKGEPTVSSDLSNEFQNKNVALVDDIVDDIWKLETQLASE